MNMSIEEETKREFKTTEALIRVLLEQDEKCRNSDKWLTYRVFEEIAKSYGKKIYIPFDIFDKFPAFETCKRTRAKLQNKLGLFMPTDPQVILRRSRREKAVKEWAVKK